MRTFFALDIDKDTKLAIGTWMERNLYPTQKPIPIANYHITLSFLGQTSEQQLERLSERAQSVTFMPFEICLDEFGFWSKPGIFWLGPSQSPHRLSHLAKDLTAIGKGLKMPMDNKPYKPHLSLLRRCKTPPPAPLSQPDFVLRFDCFYLYESISTKDGVRYQAIETFG